MSIDPIIALIPTYKEGTLVQGAIRSVAGICSEVIVFEGSTDPDVPIEGDKTDFGEYEPDFFIDGMWNSEAEKRNEMLAFTRLLYSNFWILNIDADELLVWGEQLPDLLSVLRPGIDSQENIPSFKRTEGVFVPLPPFPPLRNSKESWKQYRLDMLAHVRDWAHRQPGQFTDYAPSRLYHSSLIEEYLVSSWRIRDRNGNEIALTHGVCENPPVYGEPHLHHRPYLRRGERTGYRASFQGDEAKYMEEHGIEKAHFTVTSNE